MKTLNLGVGKYKNPKTNQFEPLPCLKGNDGDSNQGIPTGGETGQVLGKNSESDYDTHWINIPSTLPNPNKLTFEGAVTAEYDGSGAVTINIPEESSTVRVEKTSSDTTAEIEPNKLYVFPEMTSLTYTLAVPGNADVANEYHFIFKSGSTATQLVNPEGVSVPDNFAIDSNKVYEISILEGCLAYQSWEVADA